MTAASRRAKKKAMASSKRDGGVTPKNIASSPASPTKHSPTQSSPLRKGLAYGKDVFSESENDSDAGVGSASNNKKSGHDTHQQQQQQQQATASSSASVAGLSTEEPVATYETITSQEGFLRLLDLVAQEVKRVKGESLDTSRPVAGPSSLATPPSTSPSDEELRIAVADLLNLMYPFGIIPYGTQIGVAEMARLFIESREFLASLDDEGNPPPGTFDDGQSQQQQQQQQQQQAFTPARHSQQHGAQSAAANLPPLGFFTPTGQTLQILRNNPVAVDLNRLDDDNDLEFAQLRNLAASNSAPRPPTGNFAPTGQTIQAHRQSQHCPPPQAISSQYPNEDFSRAIAAANAARTAHLNPPIPHTPTTDEDTAKLDILAAVASGEINPAELLQYIQNPSSANFPVIASASATAPAPVPFDRWKSVPRPGAPSTMGHRKHQQQAAADEFLDNMDLPLSPPPPPPPHPNRRGAPQRRAALKSTELTRKMATKSELRQLVKKNTEKNAAKEAEKNKGGSGNDNNANASDNIKDTVAEASGTAEAGSSSGGNTDLPKAIDTAATKQSDAKLEQNNRVFRDTPHKKSTFPKPMARVLKKAIADAGDPHDPECVQRQTDSFHKRLDNNTFQWTESNVRGATDEGMTIERSMKDNMTRLLRNSGYWEGFIEDETDSDDDVDNHQETARDKGKQRATSADEPEDGGEQANRRRRRRLRRRRHLRRHLLVDGDEDENATVADSSLTVTDRPRAAVASIERTKLMYDAIAVWQNNPEVRDYYSERDRKETKTAQPDLRQGNDTFNSPLSLVTKGGNNPTSPPPETQSATAAIPTQVVKIADQKPKPLPTPEASFTGEASASQSFEFRMPKATAHEEKASDDAGLDGTCDVQSQPEGSADADVKKDARGKIIYDEVDFEVDNPVSPLPPQNKSKNTRQKGKGKAKAPVNQTSQIGDDPFYYDARFDPTDVYPGVLKNSRQSKKKRQLVPGDAASRERAAASKKREAEAAEELKRQREMEIINEPIEALLKELVGDAYIELKNRPDVPGSATGKPLYFDMYMDYLNSRDNAAEKNVEEDDDEGGPSGAAGGSDDRR